MKSPAGLWHWSNAGPGPGRLQDLDSLCKRARAAGLDYITFKALDGAQDRFLTDSQLKEAKQACERAGLKFSLWQYVYAVRPPSEEATSLSSLIERFAPAFVFIDVEKEYESNPGPVSAQYASAFRDALPDFPATIAPFGRADLHPGIDYKAWHDHGFGVAPQAYECDSSELTPAKCPRLLASVAGGQAMDGGRTPRGSTPREALRGLPRRLAARPARREHLRLVVRPGHQRADARDREPPGPDARRDHGAHARDAGLRARSLDRYRPAPAQRLRLLGHRRREPKPADSRGAALFPDWVVRRARPRER